MQIEGAEEGNLNTDEVDEAKGNSVGSAKHLADVDREEALLNRMDSGQLRDALRDVIAGSQKYRAEALVRVSARAYEAKDRVLFSLAFEALAKTVTPRLVARAWRLSEEDRKDEAQAILLALFDQIRKRNADFAGRFFARWAQLQAISRYRSRTARFEGQSARVEPTEDDDPIDEIADRIVPLDARLMLSAGIQSLPSRHAEAFIQVHVFGRTRKEVAKRMGVHERTVRGWLKQTKEALRQMGDNDV